MKDVLLNAMHEIIELRRRNEVLQAQCDVVQIFGAALLGPRTQGGAAEDVVWSLRQAIDKLSQQPEPSGKGE